MKTFSDEALAALERGDAIVSASVEIIPGPVTTYSLSSTTDVDMLGADLPPLQRSISGVIANDLGYQFSADPSQVIRFKPKSGGTYSGVDPNSDGWRWPLDCVADDIATTFVRFCVPGNPQYGSAALALAAVNSLLSGGARFQITGHSSYRIWPDLEESVAVLDASDGGLSVTIEFYDPETTTADPIRLWAGYGAADLPSDEGTSTFLGVGDRGLVQQVTAAVGGSAQNLTLTLSGIEPAALEVLDANEVKGAATVVRLLIFDSAGKTLLGAYVFTRGRVDEIRTSEVVGGAASIELAIEGAARALGRRGGRLRSDADQRLVSPTDGFYRVVSSVPKKTLYWGGKKPSVAGSGGGLLSGLASSGAAGVGAAT